MVRQLPAGCGLARPRQAWTTALLVSDPMFAGTVPVKMTLAVAAGARSPIEQLNAPDLVRAHRSGLPPGPRRDVGSSPEGSVSPSMTPLAKPVLMLVTLMV